jgi:hypothetical protein
MWHWPTKLIRIGLSVNMIGPFVLGFSLRATLSWFTTKIRTPWGAGKFKPMWFGPFIVKEVLKKGAYRLVDFEGNALAEPRNGLYLKKYYS